MGLWLAILVAEVAGPPVPPPQKVTPAQAAIALYHQEHDAAAPPKPCRRSTGDEITVCAQSDRLPLPAESGPRAGPRTATGEMPHVGIGGSPALQGKGAGLTLSIPFGGKTPAPVKVTGNGEE